MIATLAALAVGAIATLVRLAITRLMIAPWGVLVVNVIGSVIGGIALGSATGDLRLIVLGGLCGGLTTFSTLSVETIQLLRSGKASTAIANISANVALGILAASLGYLLIRWSS